MPLDGITLHFLRQELLETALGCRVEKIHQPGKDELVFQLRSRTAAARLYLSASANSPRVHFIEQAPENPASPPMLCMLLRKHLAGATITDIRQLRLDRVLCIDFAATDELGEKTSFTLYAEIMAKHSNLILVNAQGVIVDAVKRIDESQSSVRWIQPGLAYAPPPSQNKLSLLEHGTAELLEQLHLLPQLRLNAALQQTLEGASPLICRELASETGAADCAVGELQEAHWNRLNQSLQTLAAQLRSGISAPTLLLNPENKPMDFSFRDIRQYGFSYVAQAEPGYSKLLDRFYRERDRIDRTRQRSLDISKNLSNAIARITKKLAVQRAELETSVDREKLRIYGDLILANQYQLEKGSLFYDLENYYADNAPVRIPANPALSPNANAQKYYKDYRKAKTAEEKLTALIEDGEAELQYLETVADSLQRSGSYQEINAIREELALAGYCKIKSDAKKLKEKPLPPLQYRTADGFLILVGRNNLQNDQLSLKQARKNDLWLHTQKYPGSHVIVVCENRDIPETTILEAARIAAWHSKARDSAQVPVDYTPVRSLIKPNGAKPGKVIYHSYNTVWVTPEEGNNLI